MSVSNIVTALVTVPIADLMRVLPFKGDDDSRYALNGVLVTPYEDHALLVATNGHWMAVYESAEGRTDKDRVLELPNWFVRQVKELVDEELDGDVMPRLSSKSAYLTIAGEKEHLVIRAAEGELLVKPGLPFISEKFPYWRKVLPDPLLLEPGIFAPVAASYLARLHEAVPDEFGPSLFCYHTHADGKKPIIFRFGGMPELILALMPRSDGESAPASWPAWMLPQKEVSA